MLFANQSHISVPSSIRAAEHDEDGRHGIDFYSNRGDAFPHSITSELAQSKMSSALDGVVKGE